MSDGRDKSPTQDQLAQKPNTSEYGTLIEPGGEVRDRDGYEYLELGSSADARASRQFLISDCKMLMMPQ